MDHVRHFLRYELELAPESYILTGTGKDSPRSSPCGSSPDGIVARHRLPISGRTPAQGDPVRRPVLRGTTT